MPRTARTLLAVALLGLLAGCSRGPDLPPGAVKNDRFKFAVVPPAGWVAVSPQNANEILPVWGDRLQDTFRARLRQPASGRTRFILAYLKSDAPEELLPQIAVVHNEVGLPQVTDVEKEKARRTLREKFSVWREAKEESADIVEVDGRKAVRVLYSGSVDSRLHTAPATARTYRVKFLELMVPSKDRTHFLSLTAEQERFASYAAAFDAFVRSFRSFGGH
jgi:hypothetical protein